MPNGGGYWARAGRPTSPTVTRSRGQCYGALDVLYQPVKHKHPFSPENPLENVLLTIRTGLRVLGQKPPENMLTISAELLVLGQKPPENVLLTTTNDELSTRH